MISLSSLVKGCYVSNLDSEKKVLNFNGRFEQMGSQTAMRNAGPSEEELLNAEFAEREKEIDGFLAGLDVQKVEIKQEPTPEELIEQAKKEAEEILAKAQNDAAKITENAQKQAELLFEDKKCSAKQEGLQLAEQEKERLLANLKEEYEQKNAKLQQRYDDKMEHMETELVDVLIRVFHKVFDVQFDDKKKILLHLIKNTLMDVEFSKQFHIRVSQENVKFIESHVGDIKEKIGSDIQVEVTGDATLADSVCIIETDSGVFDCSIDVELSGLEKDIRSLCR